jgi:predicted RNA-binding protein with TRAM domain
MDDLDFLELKRPRRHGKDEKKGNHFGGSKAPRTPVSVGEEYIVTVEETGKEGVGVAKLRGVSILINNTNLGDKVMVRITKVGRTYAVAEVFSRK